jgi:hypothetical protein
MKLPVHKSVPVDKIATSPHGKIIAPPGAFSWNHGETDTDNVQAHAKANRQPATKELTKTLSARMLPFTVPAREHSSVVSLGVYALCTTCMCILEICCVGFERG